MKQVIRNRMKGVGKYARYTHDSDKNHCPQENTRLTAQHKDIQNAADSNNPKNN